MICIQVGADTRDKLKVGADIQEIRRGIGREAADVTHHEVGVC